MSANNSIFSKKDEESSQNISVNQSQSNNETMNKMKAFNEIIDFYETKLEQKNVALEHFKEKTKQLEQSLENNKIFLNMVVHDMRNPTNQIEYLLQQSLQELNGFKNQLLEIDK